MSQDALKAYSQEYINEMAKNRELSLQQIGVALATLKRQLTGAGKQVSFGYSEIEELFKNIKIETLKIVDKELTGITIKTIGRFRRLATGTDTIIHDDLLTDLQKTNSENIVAIETLKNELNLVNTFIEEKNVQLDTLNSEYINSKNELKKETEEKFKAAKELDKAKAELLSKQERMNSLKKQFDTLNDEKKKQDADLASKEAIISQLKDQSESTDQSITAALSMMEEQYQTQSKFFEEEKQKAIEEAVNQAIIQTQKDAERQFEIEVSSLKRQIEEESKAKNALEKTRMNLDSMIRELKSDRQELREEYKRCQFQLKDTSDKEYFFKELVENSDLASILILIQMGGKMNIENLAKSVGVHIVKLQQKLEELAVKKLVKIQDGDVIINYKQRTEERKKFF